MGMYFFTIIILERWEKINGEKPVCFEAKDNQYGAFNMSKSGRLKTMKLIHRSGSVHCNPETGASYWGCTYDVAYSGKLMTIITDNNRVAVLPDDEDMQATPNVCDGPKHVYSLDGTDHKSPALVFRNLSNPLSVSRNQELQIWFRQDWADCSENNNRGKTCVDVYAWYA